MQRSDVVLDMRGMPRFSADFFDSELDKSSGHPELVAAPSTETAVAEFARSEVLQNLLNESRLACVEPESRLWELFWTIVISVKISSKEPELLENWELLFSRTRSLLSNVVGVCKFSNCGSNASAPRESAEA